MSSLANVTRIAVRKSVTVAAPLALAFEVFTGRIESWWPMASHHIGDADCAAVVIEPRAGGRWYERGEDGSESEWGKVLHWDPPARVILAWQLDGGWKYNPACLTEVEINFSVLDATRTRVDFEHRYLERLGDNAQAVRDLLNSGWGGILELYVSLAAPS